MVLGRAGLAGVVCALVLGACADGGRPAALVTVNTDHALPILASEVRGGPGTRLPDGFAVPVGAVLAGPVLPDNPVQGEVDRRTVQTRGWTAVLVVDGSPTDVFSALVAQARASDFAVTGGCHTTALFVECTADTPSPATRRQARGRRVSITVDVGTQFSHATIAVDDFGGTDDVVSSKVPTIEDLSRPPTTATPLPDRGEPLFDFPARVLPGSRPIVAPDRGDCGETGSVVVLRVDDPQPAFAGEGQPVILDAYERSLTREWGAPVGRQHGTWSGWTAHNIDYDGASVTMLERPFQRYIRIAVCQ